MNKDEFDKAVAYNAGQLASGVLTPAHVTSMAVEWQSRHSLLADGKAGQLTRDSIESVTKEVLNASKPESPSTPPPATVGPPGTQFFDRRKYAAQVHGPEHEWPVTDRPIEKVTGVCLHQTACLLGERVERYDTCGAHFAVTRMGKIIWLHDFDRNVAAANGWNNGTVSIEVDGLYAGVEGDPSTVWDDPSTPGRETAMTLTPETINAVNALLRWIKQQLGPQMNVIVAHRQSSSSRQNDPGSGIWKHCALPMHLELHCTDGGIGFKLDSGKPIPEKWDPRCTGIKY